MHVRSVSGVRIPAKSAEDFGYLSQDNGTQFGLLSRQQAGLVGICHYLELPW